MKDGNISAGLSRRTALALLATAAVAPRLAAASNGVPAAFPKSPLTLIVPFSAGGPVDILGRLLAHEYQSRSGFNAVVENKTGGAGNIGIDTVKVAAPDGATLLLIPAGNLTINPALMPNLNFVVLRDFTPIILLASAPNIFLASKKLGVTTVKDLIEKAKTSKLTYGSPGVGSQLHLAMELFKDSAGIDITHVPYRGSPQGLADLLGGHIDLLSTNLPSALGSIGDKSVVPLAMTTAARSPLVPEVPTLAEAGIAGIDVSSWYGMLAPKGVPQATVDALFAVTGEILEQASIKEKLMAQALSVQIEAPGVFARRIERESAMWADVIRKHGIKL